MRKVKMYGVRRSVEIKGKIIVPKLQGETVILSSLHLRKYGKLSRGRGQKRRIATSDLIIISILFSQEIVFPPLAINSVSLSQHYKKHIG